MANMNPKIENLKSNLDRTPIERQLLSIALYPVVIILSCNI